jgi:hypothetical protein
VHPYTKGRLLLDISEKEKKILDHFEGDEYTPKEITAEVNGENVTATIYLYNDPSQLEGEWSLDYFLENCSDFLDVCKGFAQGLHDRIPV